MSDDRLSQNEPPAQQPLVQTLSKEGRWLLIAQLVPAVVGIFIGCLALYAALSEADAVRKQQQAAVWPYAEVTDNRTSNSDGASYGIYITNKGIGPARIKSFRVFVDDVEYNDWEAILLAATAQEPRAIAYSIASISQKVMSPGEVIRVVEIRTNEARTIAPTDPEETPEQSTAYYEQLIADLAQKRSDNSVRIEYCYCSVFDECWSVEQRRQEPEPVETCPAETASSPL